MFIKDVFYCVYNPHQGHQGEHLNNNINQVLSQEHVCAELLNDL